jgi:outer membrane immunogenic protein
MSLKKLILAGLAAAGVMALSGAANAADMPLKAPVYAPAFTWTGLYLGANAGYGWQDSTGDNYCVNPAGVAGGLGCSVGVGSAVKPSGGFVGGQLGYNYQTGMFVWGVETDIQVTNMQNSTGAVPVSCCIGVATVPANLTRSDSLDWFGTVRGRLGIAFWDHALLYGTGGVMYGQQTVNLLLTSPVSPVAYTGNSTSTHTGWVAGAGLEYAFTKNLSGKVEGLFYDLGSQTVVATPNVATGFTENANFKYTGSLVRIGMNVKFGP